MSRWTGPGRFTAQGGNALSRSGLADLQSKARKVVGDLENQARLGNVWYGRKVVKLAEGVFVEAIVDSTYPNNPLVQARIVIQDERMEESPAEFELTGLLSWVEQPEKNGVPIGLPYLQIAFNTAEVGLPSPYVYDRDHVRLVSTSRRLKLFNRAFPQGIQSGNVDWVSTNGQTQISWAGPNSRSFGAGSGRKVYERGVVIGEIPSAYGNVNGAAIDAQGDIVVIASDGSTLTALRTTSSGWEVLDSFNLGSNPNSESFTVGTPSFFRGDGLEATTLAYYKPFGATTTLRTAEIVFGSNTFSAEYKTVDNELKSLGFISSGLPRNASGSASLSLFIQNYTPPDPPTWAPYSDRYPVVVDYVGMAKKRMDVSIGDNFGSTVSGFLTNDLKRDETGFWTGSVMEITTSTTGFYSYEFNIGGGSRFLINGVESAELPNYGSIAFYERGSGSISGSGSARYTVTSNDDVIGGGSRTLSAQGTVNSDPSQIQITSKFFFCDLRYERYGYFNSVAPSIFSAGSISWSSSDSLSASTTGSSKLIFVNISNMNYSGQQNGSTTTTGDAGGQDKIVFGSLSDSASTPPGSTSSSSNTGFPVTSPKCPADFTFGAHLSAARGGVNVPNSRGPAFFKSDDGAGLAFIKGFFDHEDFGDIMGAASIQHKGGDYLLVADAARGNVSISGIILNGTAASESFDSTFQLGVF